MDIQVPEDKVSTSPGPSSIFDQFFLDSKPDFVRWTRSDKRGCQPFFVSLGVLIWRALLRFGGGLVRECVCVYEY
jgi:hypothetical protein